MRQLAILGILLALLAGCGLRQPEPVAIRTPFRESDHRAYLQPGTGTIRGQAFMRQQGGGVVTCAGQVVFFFPSTLFFWEMTNLLRAGREPQLPSLAGIDPAYKALFQRQAQCDAQGHFVFHQVPPGAWIVTTEVSWTVGYVKQGGGVLREVTVGDGATTEVLLSNQDFVGR